jgi:hypothetical protein
VNKVEHTPKRPAHRVDVPETSENAPASWTASAEDRFYTHLLTVLSVSSGMVGVCLTAIGLIGIVKSLNNVETFVDDLLAISSMVFMIAAILSFLGMRSNVAKSWRYFARTLDLIFCLGLVLVVVATSLLTWMVL